jgi:YgiT-type zinc finger domain-containing protein
MSPAQKKSTPKCIECDVGRLRRSTVEISEEVLGHRFTVPDFPALVCDKCGAEQFQGPALEALDLLIADELARSGELSGGGFRLMRKALGYRAVDLAELMRTTPETISRWENGKVAVDPNAFLVVAGLVADKVGERTTMLERLEAVRQPKRRAGAIVLTLAPGTR